MARKKSNSITEDEIRLRSYFIWESEGYPPGKDEDHWLRAEAELLAESATPKSRKKSLGSGTTVKKAKSKSSVTKGKSKTNTTGKKSRSR